MSDENQRFIIDNSVWQKAGHFPTIRQRFFEVFDTAIVLATPPQVLEYCYSASSSRRYREIFRPRVEQLIEAKNHPSVSEVLDLQEALWEVGYVRGAGAIDTLIAAYALVNEATLLCADTDYLLLRTASSDRLKVEYLPEA